MTRRRYIDVSSGSATLRWPCSQAVAVNGMVFLAGQTGVPGAAA
jgi:enamine deaminase RidA (YjgF/YER057c/UK114 family)